MPAVAWMLKLAVTHIATAARLSRSHLRDETDPRVKDFAFAQYRGFNVPMKSFLAGCMTFERLEDAKPVDTTPRGQEPPPSIANDEDASRYRDICRCAVRDEEVSTRHHDRHVTALAHLPPQGARTRMLDREKPATPSSKPLIHVKGDAHDTQPGDTGATDQDPARHRMGGPYKLLSRYNVNAAGSDDRPEQRLDRGTEKLPEPATDVAPRGCQRAQVSLAPRPSMAPLTACR